uniref:Uncharacterized protein n=1 Tax=Arundo donax TaxID=35708 RepID=A0A0A9DB85_ARUDO
MFKKKVKVPITFCFTFRSVRHCCNLM